MGELGVGVPYREACCEGKLRHRSGGEGAPGTAWGSWGTVPVPEGLAQTSGSPQGLPGARGPAGEKGDQGDPGEDGRNVSPNP